MPEHEKINYVEFPSTDLPGTKAFFQSALGWTFTDYGPGYSSFADEGLDGGFFQSDQPASPGGGALIVFFSQDLASTQAKIEQAGGRIVKPVFSFPGGRRFHFVEPGGNEFAVWGEGE